jgi:hypothetical protein
MSQNYEHHCGISPELFERYGRSFARMRDTLWLHAPGPAAPPEVVREVPRVAGTPIVATLKTRCPSCVEIIKRGDDAVMMDWDNGSSTTVSKALHVECAKEHGWQSRRPAA